MDTRLAVVTGASSGIGRAAALRLSRDGFRILAVARDQGTLTQLCAEIGQAGGRAEAFSVDVTAVEAPQAILRRVAAMSPAAGSATSEAGIDALVTAAGIIASASVADTTDEAWDGMLDVNVRAPFRMIRAAIPALSARRGAVVNVSSVAGARAFPNLAAYCVSKAAVDQLTRCAALDLAPRGVRVNAVNPGVVVTNLHRRGGMDEARYTAFLEHSKATHPLGRPGTPEEIADLIAYLVSPSAAWMTGETISIDGGRHLTCLR